MTEKKYFDAIDGLRAIAVVSVVLFHANIPGFSSGYLGVDIFFVISGFLITRLLRDEAMATGRIDFVGFYARRVRRLLPALVIVLLTTLLASLLILFPGELPRLGKSATAVVLMVSNLHFMKYAGGYFAPSVDVMPLLHTWSLSVEEQFYLFWPLLVLLTVRLCQHRRWGIEKGLLWCFLILFGVSLAFWVKHFLTQHTLAFYAMPARVWQLALGGIVALLAGDQTGRVRQLLSPWATNLALILLLLALGFAQSTDQQGMVLTLAVTVLSACLILLLTQTESVTWAFRLLTSSPAIWFGGLSYAWYLWHWPILALTRSNALGQRDLLRDVLAIVLALLLSWLTWKYVERPIRVRRPWVFATDKGAVLAGLVMLIGVASISEGVLHWGKRASANFDLQVRGGTNVIETCPEPADGRTLAPTEACTQGNSGPVVVVAWGDSHAGHLRGLLQAESEARGSRYLLRTFGACPPLLGVVPVKNGQIQEACGHHNEAVRKELDRLINDGVKSVILGGRWNSYLALPETNPSAINSYALMEHWQEGSVKLLKVGVPPLDNEGALLALENGLRETLRYLTVRGVRALVIAPVPEPYFNGAYCLYRHSAKECVYPREWVDQRRAGTLARLQAAVAGLPNVHLHDPINDFCDQQQCYVEKKGILIYGDTDHLTATMAASLRTSWQSEMNWVWTGK